MAIFTKKTEEKKEKKAAVPKKALAVKESALATRILSRPRITEKSYALNSVNQYVFEVTGTATKKSVKRAVEEAYGVPVLAVHMVRLPAKKRRSGQAQKIGFKNSIKKAIVKVAPGSTIELFKAGM